MEINSAFHFFIRELGFVLLVADMQRLVFLVFLLVVLLVITFAISGSEVAIFSLNNKDINMLKTRQHPAARRIINILEEPKEVYASLQIAGIFINISIIVLLNFLITTFIPYDTVQVFGNTPSVGNYIIEVLIRVGIIGLVLIFFGQILPKVWATQNNVRFAYDWSIVVEGVHLLLRRVSKWVISLADGIDKKAGANKSEAVNLQELDDAIDIKTDEEASPEEKSIMKGIVKFGTITVKQIMRSRLEVNGIEYNSSFAALRAKILELHHSRLPVYKGNMDEVAGIITTKDVVPFLDEAEGFDWRPLVRQPYFVPESRLIADLLRDFQSKRVHFAIVVDEFGGTSGIVTMEDVMEEVIGEIRDEFDEEESRDKKIDEFNYVFEGKTMIHDMCKAMHLPMDTFDAVRGESESVGGLFLEINGEFPKTGDHVASGDFEFTVLEAATNRVVLVQVTLKKKS